MRHFMASRFLVEKRWNPRDPFRASAGGKEKRDVCARFLLGFFTLPRDVVFPLGISVV